jgi:hypothetical protein
MWRMMTMGNCIICVWLFLPIWGIELKALSTLDKPWSMFLIHSPHYQNLEHKNQGQMTFSLSSKTVLANQHPFWVPQIHFHTFQFRHSMQTLLTGIGDCFSLSPAFLLRLNSYLIIMPMFIFAVQQNRLPRP